MRYLLPLLLLAGCGNKKPPANTDSEAPQPESAVTFHEAMRGNLEGMFDAHVAVIRGDMGAIKAATTKLAESPKVESFPEPWVEMQMSLMMAAGHASRAETLHEASQRVVAITKSCGDCHSHVGDGPNFYHTSGPDAEASLKARMQNHAWGADMMWKGLVADDYKLVQRGAVHLAEGVLPPEDKDKFPPEILAIEELILKDAAVAADSTSLDEQRTVLGNILPRCGTCHQAANIKPEIDFSPTLK